MTMHTIDPSGSVLSYPPAVFADQALKDECAAADEVNVQRIGRRPQYLAYSYSYIDEQACCAASVGLSKTVAVRRFDE